MFKSAGKLTGLFLLLVLSFIYTESVFDSAKKTDPVMKEIISYKKENDVLGVEPIINGDEMIIGYTGLVVNEDESYKKMKDDNKFNKDKIVFDKALPKKTISKTYEFYIKKGNPSKKEVALIFKVDDSDNLDDFLSLVAKTNVNVNFFLDGAWLEKNVETAFSMVNLGCEIYNMGYDGKYIRNKISQTNNLIESISLKDSLYCLNIDKIDDEKKVCSNKKMHSIVPTLNEPSLNELKEGLTKGAIISYDLSTYDIDKFILSINAITNRGYNITSLQNVLTE